MNQVIIIVEKKWKTQKHTRNDFSVETIWQIFFFLKKSCIFYFYILNILNNVIYSINKMKIEIQYRIEWNLRT